MSNVLEALNKGWTILDVTNVLARGQNDEGRGFLVTLMQAENHISRSLYLPYTPESEALLTQAPTL